MSFTLGLPISSPRIVNFYLVNLTKIAIVILLKFFILISYTSSSKLDLSAVKLFLISIFETVFLRVLLDPSFRTNGKLAIFLMTYFCFFHYYLSLAVS